MFLCKYYKLIAGDALANLVSKQARSNLTQRLKLTLVREASACTGEENIMLHY
jgi:hypothetical protein